MSRQENVIEAPAIRDEALGRLLEEPLDWRYKTFPQAEGVTLGTVGQRLPVGGLHGGRRSLRRLWLSWRA